MAAVSAILVSFFIFSTLYKGDCTNYQPGAIQLTEDTWQDILEGEWMVEFMAPWCPACRAFQETWDGFAKKWSRDLDIQVGVVDVTANPGLSGRFLITALPSIYHVKDGVFRQCVSGRTESDLITFIDDKRWQDVQPVSKWTAPDSIQMGMVGLFFRMAMKIRAFYTLMTEEYGIPEWGCYLIFAVLTIVTGLLLGLMHTPQVYKYSITVGNHIGRLCAETAISAVSLCLHRYFSAVIKASDERNVEKSTGKYFKQLLVCFCDFINPPKDFPPPIPQGLMQPHLDKEGDIIDDTNTADGDTAVRRRNVPKDSGADKPKDKEDSAKAETKDDEKEEETEDTMSKKDQ